MTANPEDRGLSPMDAGAGGSRVKQARKPGLLINLILSLISIVFIVAVLEIGSRIFIAVSRPRETPQPDAVIVPALHILCDCPYIYGLNSDHPEISSQGLRDREYSIPRQPGTKRVLVLGDSVTYGVSVPAEAAFPNVLEDSLDQVEVINAGVQGYTAYNELHYFLQEGIAFQADLVVVAFSMNDVVNPRRHINYAPETIKEIPVEAIPNLDYDRDHILPTIEAKKAGSLLDNFALYQAVESRLDSNGDQYAYELEAGETVVDGVRWPTYVTAEDTLSIQVLMDYQSAEWIWLRGIYDRLYAAVDGSGSRMMLVILPLAYQLDEQYPFLPQEMLARYCSERAIDCLDLLPAFRAHRSEKLFLDASEGKYDIWHLTERGHRLVASEMETYLHSSGFLFTQASIDE